MCPECDKLNNQMPITKTNKFWRQGWFIGMTVGPITAIFLLLGMLYFNYRAYAPDGDSIWLLAYIIFFMFLAAIVFCAPVLGILALIKTIRPVALPLFIFCITGICGMVLLGIIGIDQFKVSAMKTIAANGQKIIDSINSYERKFNRPPKNLSELVPEFLEEIPGTGIAAYPEFEYEARESTKTDYYGNAWILYVYTPTGGFDRFYYFPLNNYPNDIPWERIDNWAYYNE